MSLAEAREWPLQASPKASIVEARRLASPVEMLLSGNLSSGGPKDSTMSERGLEDLEFDSAAAARRLNARVFNRLLSAGEIAPRP